MKRSILTIAVLVAASLMISSSAWADLLPVSVSGTVYRIPGNLMDASSGLSTATPVAWFTDTVINFQALNGVTSGSCTTSGSLCDFLAYGGATASYSSNTYENAVMSDASTYSTWIKLTGTATFVAGQTYTIAHDDGVIMDVSGVSGDVISSPSPTVKIDSSWISTVSGSENFTIYYVATNGNPEDLILTTTAVPDGGMTVVLLGGALVALGILRRKFRV